MNFAIIKEKRFEVNQVQAIVRCLDGSFYYSMVFGCICTKKHQLANDVWYDYAYLILDKTKTKLILQHEFLPNNKSYEPMLLFLTRIKVIGK